MDQAGNVDADSRIDSSIGGLIDCSNNVQRDRRRVDGALNGDSEQLLGAVSCINGDAVGIARTRSKLVMGAAHGIGPLAVSAEVEAAIAAGHAALRHEQVGRAVCVGGGQRAAGRLDGVCFTQGSSGRALDHCSVIGARDSNGDALGEESCVRSSGVVAGDDAVGERDCFANGEEVEVDVGAVAPAGVADHEAVDQGSDIGRREVGIEAAAGPGDASVGLADGDNIGGIELGEGEAAGCGECSAAITLGEVTSGGDGLDDGLVIGARDGDGDALAGRIVLVVVHRDGEGFGEGFTHGQGLNGRVGVVEGVSPALAAAGAIGGAANSSEAEAAVLGGAGGDAGGLDVGDIEIREGHRTGGDQAAVFSHNTALGGARDNDLVIGADDRDGDAAGNRATVVIKDMEGEGFNLGLTCCEVLNVTGGNAVGPGDQAAETGAVAIGRNASDEGAEGAITLGDGADGMQVG